jgi:hypothetical protein
VPFAPETLDSFEIGAKTIGWEGPGALATPRACLDEAPEVRRAGTPLPPQGGITLDSRPDQAGRSSSSTSKYSLRPALHGYCRRLAGNLWDAEDLAHDTLLRAFGQWGVTTPEIRNPRAYLLRTATNVWIDTLRRRETEARAPLANPEDARRRTRSRRRRATCEMPDRDSWSGSHPRSAPRSCWRRYST